MRYNMRSVAFLAAVEVARGLDLSVSLQMMEAELGNIAEELEGLAINALASVEHLGDTEKLAETSAP